MKKIITTFLLMTSFSSFACQCSNYTMDAEPTVEAFFKKYYGVTNLDYDNIELTAYYPSREERLDYAEMGSNSCFDEGPNGEPMFHCALKTKADLTVKIPEKNCEVKIRVKTTEKKVSVKKLKTNC